MVLLREGFLGLVLCAITAWRSVGANAVNQEALNYNSDRVYDAGLFTPLEDLALLSGARFTTLNHPAFPDHGVRIKRTRFCDGTVNSYTGYIDVGSRHLFFYFFESRSDPDKDDVILWTNGGPGASSSFGLFMEQGPCRVVDANTTKFHPESWNSKANMFFIDQPVGVGWSYADYGEHVGTTEEAAEDIAAFIAVFFEHFHKFKGRAFHMAGESYGGRYIPVYAAGRGCLRPEQRAGKEGADSNQPELYYDWEWLDRLLHADPVILPHASTKMRPEGLLGTGWYPVDLP